MLEKTKKSIHLRTVIEIQMNWLEVNVNTVFRDQLNQNALTGTKTGLPFLCFCKPLMFPPLQTVLQDLCMSPKGWGLVARFTTSALTLATLLTNSWRSVKRQDIEASFITKKDDRCCAGDSKKNHLDLFLASFYQHTRRKKRLGLFKSDNLHKILGVYFVPIHWQILAREDYLVGLKFTLVHIWCQEHEEEW